MNNNKMKLYGVIVGLIIVCGMLYLYINNLESNKMSLSINTDEKTGINVGGKMELSKKNATNNIEDTETNNEITVYICGAVISEGVYSLEAGARVNDVLTIAGGFREDASKNSVNLARYIQDGEQIIIPTIEEVENGNYNLNKNENNLLININNASKSQLITLPGIGEAKADAIIKHREKNGLFKRKEDVMNVPGIKDAVYENIKDLITI